MPIVKDITSIDNPIIKQVASLHHAKYRTLHTQFIAQGNRICTTIIHSGAMPTMLYVTQSEFEKEEWIEHYPCTLVTDQVMKKISTMTTPSGVLGVFPIPSSPPPEQLGPGIVLFGLQDPGNIGTLLRSCVAFGLSSAVFIDSADPWNPKVVQASAGYIATVTLFQLSWQELQTHKKRLPLYALVPRDGNDPRTIKDPGLFIVGSEAHGIPHDVIAACDAHVTIAMPGNVESLNAAIAGSIALYLAVVK